MLFSARSRLAAASLAWPAKRCATTRSSRASTTSSRTSAPPRASCGQEAHKTHYDPAPAECHLFAQLAQAGYTPQALLNHNGRFDNFRREALAARGGRAGVAGGGEIRLSQRARSSAWRASAREASHLCREAAFILRRSGMRQSAHVCPAARSAAVVLHAFGENTALQRHAGQRAASGHDIASFERRGLGMV